MPVTNVNLVAVQNDIARVSWTGDNSSSYPVSYTLNGGASVTMAPLLPGGRIEYLFFGLSGSLVVTVAGVVSNAVTVGSLVTPQAVTGVTLTADQGTHLYLAWSEPTKLRAKRFLIEKQTNSGAWQFYSYAQRGVEKMRVFGNAPTTLVRYRVTAEADGQSSAATESNSFVMAAASGATPAAPSVNSFLPANSSALSARVVWPDFLADTIELETSINSGSTWQRAAIIPAPICQSFVTGFTASQGVQVRARAIGVGGVSAYSAVVSATTFAPGITCSPTNTYHPFILPETLASWNAASTAPAGTMARAWWNRFVEHAINDNGNRQGIEHAFEWFRTGSATQVTKGITRLDGVFPPTNYGNTDTLRESRPWSVLTMALLWPAMSAGDKTTAIERLNYAYRRYSTLQNTGEPYPGYPTTGDDDTTYSGWLALALMSLGNMTGANAENYIFGQMANGGAQISSEFGGHAPTSVSSDRWTNSIERYAGGAEGGAFITQSTAEYDGETGSWLLPLMSMVNQAYTFQKDFGFYHLTTLRNMERSAKLIAHKVAPDLGGVITYGDNDKTGNYTTGQWFTFHWNPSGEFLMLNQIAALFDGYDQPNKARAIDLLEDVMTGPLQTGAALVFVWNVFAAGVYKPSLRGDRTTEPELIHYGKGTGALYGRTGWGSNNTWAVLGNNRDTSVDHDQLQQDRIMLAKGQTAIIREPIRYFFNDPLISSQLLIYGAIPVKGNSLFPIPDKLGNFPNRGYKEMLAAGGANNVMYARYENYGRAGTTDLSAVVPVAVRDQVVEQFMLLDDVAPVFVHHGRALIVDPKNDLREVGDTVTGAERYSYILLPFRANIPTVAPAEVTAQNWIENFAHAYSANIVAPTLSSPTVSGGQATWQATNGDTVRMQPVIPASAQFTVTNLGATRNNSNAEAPASDWGRSWSVYMGDGTRGVGTTPTPHKLLYAVSAHNAAVTSTATTQVTNATYPALTDGIVVNRSGLPNAVVVFDGRNANESTRPRTITQNASLQFSQTTTTASVHFVGIDPAKTWEINTGGGPVALAVNADGYATITTTGVGLKTVELTTTGGSGGGGGGGGGGGPVGQVTILLSSLQAELFAATTQTAERAAIIAALPNPVAEVRQGTTVLSVVTLQNLEPIASTPLRLRCGATVARSNLAIGTADNIVLKNGSTQVLSVSISPATITSASTERLTSSGAFADGVFITMSASKPA